MSAVVRVKRHIDDEPLNALVLNCKKRKIDEADIAGASSADQDEGLLSSKDEVSTILKFAGTVETQDENISAQITKLTRDDAKQLAQKTRQPINLTERKRQEMRNAAAENRFRVVNCFRSATNVADTELAASKEITVFDIEKQTGVEDKTATDLENATSQQTISEVPIHREGYVYDLYLPEEEHSPDIEDDLMGNLFSIRPFDDLINDRYDNIESDGYETDDDSNEENNWRNDYPDTEEDEASVGEDDMREAVRNIDLEGDRELSSDDENCTNGFVYSVDSEAIGFEDDLDYCDVHRYGEAYARYNPNSLSRTDQNDDDYDSTQDLDYDSS